MCVLLMIDILFASGRRHTICALVTGVQTCALPISGDHDAVERAERLGGTLRRLAEVGRDPRDVDVGLLAESAGLQRLGHRELEIERAAWRERVCQYE